MMSDTEERKPILDKSGLTIVWGFGLANSVLTIAFLAGAGLGSSLAGDSFTLFAWLISMTFVFGQLYNTIYRKFSIIIAILAIIAIYSIGLKVLHNLDIIRRYLTPREQITDWAMFLLVLGLALFMIGILFHERGKHEDKYMPLVSLIVISFLLVGLYGVLAGYSILTSSLSFPEFQSFSYALISLFFAFNIVPSTLALMSDLDVF